MTTIPPAAVEAAAKAISDAQSSMPWADHAEEWRAETREQAQAALTAALPHMAGWRKGLDSAPRDGTEILAAISVHGNDGEFLFWERHVIKFDDESVGYIPDDYEKGWGWEDYEYWMPLPTAPAEEPKP